MTNEQLQQFHQMAMDNSELALIALHQGDVERFHSLSAQAFIYEKKAALGLYDQQIEPSRSVIFRSAGYIALDNADFVEAQKLYEYALDGDVPDEILEELDELKTEIDRIKVVNEDFVQHVLIRLRSEKTTEISQEIIHSAIDRMKKLYDDSEIRELNFNYIDNFIKRQFSTFSENHTTIDGETEYEPWIHAKKGGTDKKFWNRYSNFLLREENWAQDTIDKLDDVTDDILDHLKDPKVRGDWDKRGMVVGQVQSGKTSNYIGLMSKAADYGYRIIVVLAGTTNDLRSQTQLRTDIGFLGWDTKVDRDENDNRNFGVSKYDNQPQSHYLTTSAMDGDFKTTNRYTTGTNPRVGTIAVVMKKNPTVLKEFILWFADRADELGDGKRLIKDLPILLIDDEADNASVNISSKSVSSINGLIRSLLSLFQQSAYVGYTATPFANVFIPLTDSEDQKSLGLNIRLPEFWKFSGEDLFPKDFIINTSPPSNYIGPKELFGIDIEISANPEDALAGLPLVRRISDYTNYFPDKHKMLDIQPEGMPDTMHEAIKAFILVCAIRRSRGQMNVHNSMLIHVTRYLLWQNNVASKVNGLLKFYQRQIEYNQGGIVDELEKLFETDFLTTSEQIMESGLLTDFEKPDWFEVKTQLKKAASKIQVRAIHGDTTQVGLDFDNISSLDYYDHRKDGLSVIAIGGNKLSRGLTLEGLSISYYLRAAKMYDTLMQMGRWFGYRPGYGDLCRLYTSEELIDWYKYITIASEELRAEFEDMKILRQSPRKFGLKVREHPGVLQITATNKMRTAQRMELTFSDKLRETWRFKRDISLIRDNYNHTRNFISALNQPVQKYDQAFTWENTGNSETVIGFLKGYKAYYNLEHEKIIEYIEKQSKNGYLLDWTIVLISNQTKPNKAIFEINGKTVNIGMTMRSDANLGKGSYDISKSHIIDPKHEYLDFEPGDNKYHQALQLTIQDWNDSTRRNKRPTPPEIPSGKNIRRNRSVKNGLLLIYPLDPKPKGWESSILKSPIIGYAISFPKNNKDKKLTYKVNEVFMNDYDYENELDDLDEDSK